MSKNIVIVRGDDSNFLDETLLIINFSSEDINLDGFKAFLTIENYINFTKTYSLKDGSVEIILGKHITSTLKIGTHRCNIKLIDTLGRIRTVKTFDIKVVDEFDIDDLKYNEHIIDVSFSSKDYNMLFNKPSINGVELTGNKSLEELGIQPEGDYAYKNEIPDITPLATYEYVNNKTNILTQDINNLENNKADINYVDRELNTKQNILTTSEPLKFGENELSINIDNQTIQINSDGELVANMDELGNEVNSISSRLSNVEQNYANKSDLSNKQDKLIAGENIVIDENNTISATLEVESGIISVNGKKGEVILTAEDVGALPDTTDIPSLEGYATEKQLTQGLGTKQDKGDYALKEEIPSLEEYVKDTDYATYEKAGIVKTGAFYGLNYGITGLVSVNRASDEEIKDKQSIYKPIVPKNLDQAVKTGVTTNTIELSADEKANAKAWLGYADNTDIMQAIASIPQFNLSIVDELPLAGEKMTLYLVPKEGTNNDVYDEYIWIEQTESFEHLGTTAVDLTDYVKNTDYATDTVGGVVKISGSYFGLAFNSSKQLYVNKATDSEVTAKASHYKPIVPSNLDSAVKTGITTNTIELTDEEKTSARTWIGAIGTQDYANATTAGSAGIVKCSSTFACGCTNGYIQAMNIPTLERYNNLSQYAFIGKATLETALTQYSKTVLTTEADYEALETKDANTLYLIEE